MSAEKLKIAAEMIAAGATDQAITDRLNAARSSVQRHRRNHVMAPAKAIAEAASKGSDVREGCAELMAAAQAGDPAAAFIGLTGIILTYRRCGIAWNALPRR